MVSFESGRAASQTTHCLLGVTSVSVHVLQRTCEQGRITTAHVSELVLVSTQRYVRYISPSPRVFLQLGHIGSAFSLSVDDVDEDEEEVGVAFGLVVNLTGTRPFRLIPRALVLSPKLIQMDVLQ